MVRGRGGTNGGTILEEADTRRHRIVIGRTLEEGKELYEEVGGDGIWRKGGAEINARKNLVCFGSRDQTSCCQKVPILRAKAVTVANSCHCNKSLQ